MARSTLWGLIAILHFPFCLYISVIAGQVTMGDEINNPDVGGQPYEVSQDDADKAGNVSLYISIFAGLFGTITDLLDFIILYGLTRLHTTIQKKRTHPTPTPQVTSLQPLSSKVGYLILVLRFIMITFWFSALVWGLTPTDVLMYIDIDPGDDIDYEDPPNYSDAVIGFIVCLLVLDVISCMSPLIERCFLYFIPQGFSSLGKAGEKPAGGHREIGSVGLGPLKSAVSIPIGHTLSVEDV